MWRVLYLALLLSFILLFTGCSKKKKSDKQEKTPISAYKEDKRTSAIKRLKKASKEYFAINFEDNIPTFIGMNFPIPQSVGTNPVIQALYFIKEYKDIFGFKDPSIELFPDRINTLSGGIKLVVFKQKHANVPVFGSNLVIGIYQNKVIFASGRWLLPESKLELPKLNSTQALEKANKYFTDMKILGLPKLVIFNGKILGLDNKKSIYAWQIPLEGIDTSGKYVKGLLILNAYNGKKEFFASSIAEAKRFNIYNVSAFINPNVCILTINLIYTQDGPAPGYTPGTDPLLDDLYAYSHAVYDFFLEEFNRDSLDNDGIPFNMFGKWNVDNAMSIGPCMSFGNDFTTLSTVGHEFIHGIIGFTSGLIYANQPGALNESFADVFAELLEEKKGGGADWLMCRRSGSCYRNLRNPPDKGHPDHMDDFVPCPPGQSPSSGNDFCGVHTNSGIPNKVAYMLAKGGAHRGFTINPIGVEKVEDLYYTTMLLLPSNASFAVAANSFVFFASLFNRLGMYGFTSEDLCNVRNAWASVGVLPQGDKDCDGVLDNFDADDDGDGIPDSMDNCPDVFNPDQTNTDREIANHPNAPPGVIADDLGDACDPDMDGDGVVDAYDNDGDGIPDEVNDTCLIPYSPYSDRFLYSYNPGNNDYWCTDNDNDGILNPDDNCLDVYNPLQEDLDGDNIGDKCDPDIDGDRVLNEEDNCVYVRNPGQEDSDKDGFGDACDNCPTSNPSNEDLDGDGFPDQPDADGDGAGDVCDLDDDNDGVPDTSDTCPGLRNFNRDFDNDGKDTACDPDEAYIFDKGQVIDISPNEVVKIAFNPCLFNNGCPNIIGEDFRSPVTFRTYAENVNVRIVDEEGNIIMIGRYEGYDTNQRKVYDASFLVDPETYFKSPDSEMAFRNKKYFLEIVAGPNAPGQIDVIIEFR